MPEKHIDTNEVHLTGTVTVHSERWDPVKMGKLASGPDAGQPWAGASIKIGPRSEERKFRLNVKLFFVGDLATRAKETITKGSYIEVWGWLYQRFTHGHVAELNVVVDRWELLPSPKTGRIATRQKAPKAKPVKTVVEVTG